RLPSANSIKDRIFDIYGKNTAESLFEEVHFDGKSYQITGLFCKPELAKKVSTIQYISMNGRSISSKVISAAVSQAFQGFIHKELKPHYFIFIHMDPSMVDVNVHPRKLEVRFENQDEIFRSVFKLARSALENNTKLNNEIKREEEIVSEPIRENYTPVGSRGFSYSTKEKISYSSTTSKSTVNDVMNFSQFVTSGTPTEYKTSEVEEVQNFKPFQVLSTYIVFESDSRVVFIDQHAAAEKILFEKILFSSNNIKTKPLLVPEVVELRAEEKELILHRAEDLKKIGIGVEDFGGKDIQITEVPEDIEHLNARNYIDAIIHNEDDFSSLAHDYAGVSLPTELYYLVALTACHGSIRAGQKLNEAEMLQIINDLPKLKNPQSCPHGRPIRWILNKSDIEKNFKRIV
ncbi:MAG: hypothetical protein ABIM99_01135, partial [Candidatus Dojkabacteria bacterium]